MTLEQASDKLGIDRTTLHRKLSAAKIDIELLQNVQEILGINVNAPDRSTQNVAIVEKKIDEVPMRLSIIHLKNGRIMEVWEPKDFNTEDLNTLRKWIDLRESTL